jgi:citrate lyase subunit beta/citryl-CoA lyase
MFVPGHQQKMIDKVFDLKLDAAIFDLEDSVPLAEKHTARALVAETLACPPAPSLRFVRVHPAGSSDIEMDVRAVIRPGLDGLVLPKVHHPDDILQVDAILKAAEASVGLRPGSVQLIATIESARGLIQAPAIAASCSRLIGLMFGAEDFPLDLGMFAIREGEAGEMLYARSAIAIAAASEHLQAIDRVYLDIRDPDGLLQDVRQARQLGFTGKALIHPAQIEAVDSVFRPTVEELDYARRVVTAFEAAEAAGQRVIAVDGQMVDVPVVERARRILKEKAQTRSAQDESPSIV